MSLIDNLRRYSEHDRGSCDETMSQAWLRSYDEATPPIVEVRATMRMVRRHNETTLLYNSTLYLMFLIKKIILQMYHS
jgi:hypothetical protein